MAINIARLGVVLGIDTAEFTKGIETAKKKLGDIGQFAMRAGAVATAALGAMTYKAMQFADEMSDLSDATGVSIARITQMGQALTMSGGRADDAGKILVKFAQNIDEAANGSQKMQDAFAKAGISLTDLSKLSVEELFLKTSEGIAKVGDKATQTGLKLDLMGKGMRSVDMGGFNTQIAQGAEEFQKYENAIRIAAELNDKLAKKASETSLVFTQKVLPAVNAFYDAVNIKGGLAEKVFDGIANIIYGMAGFLQYANAGLALFSNQWELLRGRLTLEDFNRSVMNIENNLKLGIHSIKEYRSEVDKIKPPAPKGDAGRPVNQSPEVKKLNEMMRVAGLISEEYERQQSFSLAQLAIRNQMVGMTEDERRIQEAINQVLISTSQKIDEITKKREDAIGRADPKDIEKLKKVYDDEIAEVQRLSQQYVDGARIIESSSIQAQRTFEFGWNKAFAQYAEDAFNYAKFAEEAFKSITGNMTSAIDQFVETGKFSFSNFAESIIKDLIKIELRMQAMQLFSMGRGLLGGLLGLGGGATAGGATGSFVSPTYGGVGVAADGGMISGPTIVGENGPELFIPQRSGTVIPNQQMSGMAGDQPTIVYNGPYINQLSAIDTQSATQFLAKNKNAVWSANQSASRGMPTSR